MTRDSKPTPNSRSGPVITRVLCEVREDLVPHGRGADGDFSNIDAKLFARIAAEKASPSRSATILRLESHRAWTRRIGGGLALVAAAAAAVFVLRVPESSPGPQVLASAETKSESSEPRLSEPATEATPAGSAASFHGRQGSGDIRIAGSVAQLGNRLRVSEVVETADARAMFVSGTPARPAVSWMLEERSQVQVKHQRSPLVLALEAGAVEAQVAPVAHGEAFAVDVDGVRVAVHGTHLRVWRNAGHVVLDLTEGVVAVGAIPGSGMTQGTVVTAPAHVEFDTADLQASLRIDRTPAAVREAVTLGPSSEGTPRPATRDGSPQIDKPVRPSAIPTPPAMSPEEIIAKGVRACVANQLREAAVRVTVSSKLSLKVEADGSVSFARFNPPLEPEAQECASRVIYKTRFPRGGDVEIPLSIN